MKMRRITCLLIAALFILSCTVGTAFAAIIDESGWHPENAVSLISKKCLHSPLIRAILSFVRGISAVGSAPHWQCGGQGFKSPMLH